MSHTDPGWTVRELRKAGKPRVEWLALGSLDNSEFRVGILRDGTWVIETADGLAVLNEDSSFNFALTLLESTFGQVSDKICGYLQQFKLDSSTVLDFPYQRLAIHGLRSDGYWIRKAIDWLHDIELNSCQRNEVRDVLLEIESDRRLEQNLRHSAKRLRMRVQSSSPY